MRFAVASPSCHEALAHSSAAALTLWLLRTGAKLRATEVRSALPGYQQRSRSFVINAILRWYAKWLAEQLEQKVETLKPEPVIRL